jgi:hypothetical protein
MSLYCDPSLFYHPHPSELSKLYYLCEVLCTSSPSPHVWSIGPTYRVVQLLNLSYFILPYCTVLHFVSPMLKTRRQSCYLLRLPGELSYTLLTVPASLPPAFSPRHSLPLPSHPSHTCFFNTYSTTVRGQRPEGSFLFWICRYLYRWGPISSHLLCSFVFPQSIYLRISSITVLWVSGCEWLWNRKSYFICNINIKFSFLLSLFSFLLSSSYPIHLRL